MGALGTTVLRRLAGLLFKKPSVEWVPVKALPAPLAPPVMLESFESMLCRRGIPIRSARALVAAGFDRFALLEQASDEDLLAIKGVGPETVRGIRAFIHHDHRQLEGEPV
jgi:hypothetical protein